MRPFIIYSFALLVAGCTAGGSYAITPNPASPQAGARIISHHVANFVNHYPCPATGTIVYVSDYNNGVINIYNGDFAGQTPCGQIRGKFLSGAEGLYVQPATHDLYVAYRGLYDVEVFHRGQTTAYNKYVDHQFPNPGFMDVVVAKDGTLITTSIDCVLSTWIVGANGGTFVGDFNMKNCQSSYLSYLTIDKNDTIFYDGVIGGFLNNHPAVFYVSCPHGKCGRQTNLQELRPALLSPEGMAFDSGGKLLVTVGGDYPIDSTLPNGSTAEAFDLPNPKPKVFHISGLSEGMAIDQRTNHWFVAGTYDGASEYSYPSGTLIGTVPANSNGYMDGIAVDH